MSRVSPELWLLPPALYSHAKYFITEIIPYLYLYCQYLYNKNFFKLHIYPESPRVTLIEFFFEIYRDINLISNYPQSSSSLLL